MAVALQSAYGWRSVLLVGAVVSVISLIMLIALLPESVDFLVTRRPRDLQVRLERIARRLGQPVEAAAATVRESEQRTAGGEHRRSTMAGIASLFGSTLRRSTLLVWAAFFATMFGFYFVNSWTPRLLVNAGMTADQGVTVGVALALGGAVGSVLYGALAARVARRRLLVIFLVLSAAMVVVFVLSTAVLSMAFVLGGIIGLLVNGCVAGLYTITPALYRPDIRATGVGVALGIGRLGAILAPISAGILLDAAWTTVQLYLAVAVMFVIGAVAVGFIRKSKSDDATVSRRFAAST